MESKGERIIVWEPVGSIALPGRRVVPDARRALVLPIAVLAAFTALGCGVGDIVGPNEDVPEPLPLDARPLDGAPPDELRGQDAPADQRPTTVDQSTQADAALDASTPDAALLDTPVPDAGPRDPRAWLHADLWSVFWQDRTRCGAERSFLEICERRGVRGPSECAR